MRFSIKHNKENKAYRVRAYPIIILSMLFMVMFIGLIALSTGAVPINKAKILAMFVSKSSITRNPLLPLEETIVLNIRMPRVLLAMLVGGALGSSGAALQGLFRNPLVEPGIVGISGGASLMAVFAFVFTGSSPFWSALLGTYFLPVLAFAGSLGITLFAYRLSKQNGKTNIATLILVGVALNAIVYALIGLVLYFADDAAIRAYTFWNLGDLGGATWKKIIWFGPFILLPQLGLVLTYRGLDGFALGESEAFYSGVKIENTKHIVIVLSALTVGSAVAISGTIGFIGLVVPHILRALFGPGNKIILSGSMICGGGLLMVSDLISRTIVAPSEIPIGIITALIGAPFFIYLIVSQTKFNTAR